MPYSIKGNSYIVDKLWGWEIEAIINSLNDFEIHIFAPFKPDYEIEFPFYIDTESVFFHPLPYFKPYYQNILDFCKKLPKIMFTILNHIKKEDIVQIPGTAYPPIGLLTNYILFFKNYKKRIAVLDADFIGDIGVYLDYESNISKKLLFYIIKNFYAELSNFHVKSTPLTFVFGDNLFERYKKYGNVKKVYGSWIKENDIIKSSQINKKIDDALKRDEIRLCFVGSLTTKKNPICAVNCAKILKARNIPFILDIMGEGPLKTKIKKQLKENNLNEQVFLKGIIPYGGPFYNKLRIYDAILIPNLSGEQPRIIFDALANGVIVIGSDILSFSIISSEVNGFLCNPNEPLCFANVIENIYKDKNRNLFEKLIYNGVQTANENTIEYIYNQRMEIIKKTFKI